MRDVSSTLMTVAALLLASPACDREARPARAAIPAVDLHVQEQVSVPVRITARETLPTEAG